MTFTIPLPFVFVSILLGVLTNHYLEENSRELTDSLEVYNIASELMPSLLTQDDATKAMLIDLGQLETYSERKINAYDKTQSLLEEISKRLDTPAEKELIVKLNSLDESTLRPLDTKILELLFEDMDKAREQKSFIRPAPHF